LAVRIADSIDQWKINLRSASKLEGGARAAEKIPRRMSGSYLTQQQQHNKPVQTRRDIHDISLLCFCCRCWSMT